MDQDRERKLISRRKFLVMIASTGAGSLAFIACGTPSAGTGATPAAGETPAAGGEAAAPTTDAAAAVPTEAPTPTPVVLGSGSQRVVIWHGLGGADGATFVQMLGTYSSEHPDLTLSSELFSDWNVFYQKLPTATAAGTPPDVGIMHSWAIKQFADQGILQDADTIFFQPGLLPKDDFNPTLISEITVNDLTQAVPFDNHGWLNWVNTKVIEDAGLDPNALPTNGEEFITWAKQIVVDDAGKHPDEDGFNPDRVQVWATHTAWQRFTMVSSLWQFGGGAFSDDGTTSLLNTPESIAAVKYWTDLIFTHHVVPPAVPGVASPGDLFKTNSIALMWDGTWNLNFFKDNPDAQAVMKPMFINSMAPDGTQAVRFDSHMLVVPAGVADANLQAGQDLVVWLLDNGETWATSGQVPARLSVQEKQSVQDIESVAVAAQQFAEIGRAGQSHRAINEIVTTYEAAFSAALSGTTPPEQAMNEAHTAVQAILDRG
jgi:multiple sugar transport system substrate-binding protein